MGYSTQHQGVLKFVNPLSDYAWQTLAAMFGEDCRDHPEWDIGPPEVSKYLTFVDLEFSSKFDGIQWINAEKTSPMDGLVNVIIREMRKKFPDFALTGELLCQGDDIEDRWRCRIGPDGFAHRVDDAPSGMVECPSCSHRFEP